MSEFIKGEAEILAIYDGTAYVPFACLTSNEISESRSVIESQTKCNPGVVTKTAGTYSYEISLEGEYIKPETSKESWAEIRDRIRDVDGSTINWRITTTYADASTDVEYGTAVFTELSKSAPAGDELITFSASLSGSGKPSATDPNA